MIKVDEECEKKDNGVILAPKEKNDKLLLKKERKKSKLNTNKKEKEGVKVAGEGKDGKVSMKKTSSTIDMNTLENTNEVSCASCPFSFAVMWLRNHCCKVIFSDPSLQLSFYRLWEERPLKTVLQQIVQV